MTLVRDLIAAVAGIARCFACRAWARRDRSALWRIGSAESLLASHG